MTYTINATYRRAFDAMHQHGIDYCVYKGGHHLTESLKGEDDVDIIVFQTQLSSLEKVLKATGFQQIICPTCRPHYIYISYDPQTERTIILDVVTCITLGKKPARAWQWPVGVPIIMRRTWDEQRQLYRICAIDEAWLSLMTMLCDLNAWHNDQRQAYVQALWQQHSYKQLLRSPIALDAQQLLGQEAHEIHAAIIADKFSPKIYYQTIMAYMQPSFIARMQCYCRVMQLWRRRAQHYIAQRLSAPKLRIRKRGKLYVIAGVDGCGKSTQVNYLLAHPYFNITGLKRLYFGHAEFWIPGLAKWLTSYVNRPKKNSIERFCLAILKFIDRRGRLLLAHFYCWQGNHVVCDRYFYDDIMMLNTKAYQNRPRVIKYLQKALYSWLGPRPAHTFFLDIAPEIAYQRKQEYPLFMVKENVTQYRALFNMQPEVSTLQADDNIDYIHTTIARILQEG